MALTLNALIKVFLNASTVGHSFYFTSPEVTNTISTVHFAKITNAPQLSSVRFTNIHFTRTLQFK
jgi:hypothetical protein